MSLHLNFALNFNHLVDKMIDNLQDKWKNPLNCPVVIFPDPALEHWFKLHWIERTQQNKNRSTRSIANLNSKELEKFIFEILSPHSNDENPIHPLTVNILRNIILAWLQLHQNDVQEILGNDVAKYLGDIQENDKHLVFDENKLFDFANKIAWCFLDYEKTRPENFGKQPGVFETWKNDLNAFTGTSSETWQRKLYQVIFGTSDENGLLCKLNQIHPDGSFQTHAALFHQLKNNSIQFNYDSSLPVYIFWEAGMRQLYRVILDEFAKTNEVYAYVQNPCMDFWEDTPLMHSKHYNIQNNINHIDYITPNFNDPEQDFYAENENMLLCKWGQAGRDNIRLWCESAKYDFDMDGTQNTPSHTLLSQIQTMIAERSNILSEVPESSEKGYFADDKSFSLTAAPSKIREIENLHTRICKLIQSGTHTRDILVIAPDINVYRTAIKQVFDQAAELIHRHKKDKMPLSTPATHIPYTIIDGSSKESLAINALRILLKIRSNKGLTRPDFFALMNNALVQNVRNISPEDVNIWESWVSSMNVYRDANNRHDWIQGVYRLLSAKLSSTPIHLGNCADQKHACAVPFQNIDTSDDTSLLQFVDNIQSLENFIHDFSDDKLAFEGTDHTKTLDEFVTFLNSWIAMKNVPKTMISENIIYQNMIYIVEGLKIQHEIGANSISWQCFEQSVLTTVQQMSFTVGNIFVNGITFMSLAYNRIMPAKNVFFIGMDSTSFPSRSNKNTLDLRTQVKRWPGDLEITSRNLYAFLTQLMCTTDAIHISYVNLDLKKDRQYYPSTVINTLRSFLQNAISKEGSSNSTKSIDIKTVWPENSISLDEVRPWEDLFTGREFRNKKAFQQLMNSPSDSSNSSQSPAPELSAQEPENSSPEPENTEPSKNPYVDVRPDKVRLSQLENFLNDPFQFYISRILSQDKEEAEQKIEFEPIDLDNMSRTRLFREIVNDMMTVIQHNPNLVKEKTLSSQTATPLLNQLIHSRLKALKREGAIPDEEFGKKVTIFLKSRVEKLCNKLLEDYSEWPELSSEDLILNAEDNHIFTLTGTRCRCIDHDIIELTSSLPSSLPLKQYITALVLIAENKVTQPLNLKTYGFEHQNIKVTSKSLDIISSEDARNILVQILRLAYGDCAGNDIFYRCLPALLLNEEFSSLQELLEKLDDKHGPWAYFDKKNIFDREKQIGYQSDLFSDQWKEATATMKSLILFNNNKE